MTDKLDSLEKKTVLNKTKLELEKESKAQAEEFSEHLEAVGQESELKAAKWVIETEKQNEKESQKVKDDLAEFFSDKKTRREVKTYSYYLAKLLYKSLLNSVVFPKGFQWRVTHNVRGVAVIIRDPRGQFQSKGFKPCGQQKYDLNALSKIYWACENVIDDYEEETSQKTSSQERNDQKKLIVSETETDSTGEGAVDKGSDSSKVSS